MKNTSFRDNTDLHIHSYLQWSSVIIHQSL